MALCFDSLLLLAGQASTHNRHPVQSSGETCKRIPRSLEVTPSRLRRFEARGRTRKLRRVVNFRADYGMRTNQHAFSTLNAEHLDPTLGICCAMLRFSH